MVVVVAVALFELIHVSGSVLNGSSKALCASAIT